MFGKYYDNRVHQHFVHTYSRVPYLDSQIFDIQTASIKEARRMKVRTGKAAQGLQRARLKSELLSNGLRESRVKRQEKDRTFILDMENSYSNFLEKEKSSWNEFTAQKAANKEEYLRGQIYLSDKLKSTSTKAASRLMSVRRWD